jgi:hypothetical protein
MAFYECFTLKLRQGSAVLIGLACPHSAHGGRTGASETVNLLGVMGKMDS